MPLMAFSTWQSAKVDLGGVFISHASLRLRQRHRCRERRDTDAASETGHDVNGRVGRAGKGPFIHRTWGADHKKKKKQGLEAKERKKEKEHYGDCGLRAGDSQTKQPMGQGRGHAQVPVRALSRKLELRPMAVQSEGERIAAGVVGNGSPAVIRRWGAKSISETEPATDASDVTVHSWPVIF